MEQVLPWIIRILGGAVGGNVVGKLFGKLSLGTLGNSIAGILGGGIGGQILQSLGVGANANGALDLTSVLSNIGASAAGGGVLMAIIGFIKKAMGKS